MWPPPFPPDNIADAIIDLGWIGCVVVVLLFASVFVPDIAAAVRADSETWVSDDD